MRTKPRSRIRQTALRVTGVGAMVLAGVGGAPTAAVAYVGPGAGLTAIGSALALVGGILLAVVGFVWYPVKRLRARLRRKAADKEARE